MSKVSTDAYFPAGQENIDNIPNEEAGFQEDFSLILDLEPMDLNDLGTLYEAYASKLEEIDAAMVEIKKTIFDKMETDSEVAGNYLCYKAKTAKFPELTLDKARDLGLTKVEEKIDGPLCKKAHQNGVNLGKVEWSEAMVMKKKKIENEGNE